MAGGGKVSSKHPETQTGTAIMAQPKPLFKNVQNDRECASTVNTCGHSANHSASLHTASTDQEILENLGLATPITAFHSSQTGKILHLFPQLAPSTIPQYIRDIETLKPAKLKQAYPKEHNSWRSRMDYAQKRALAFTCRGVHSPYFFGNSAPFLPKATHSTR